METIIVFSTNSNIATNKILLLLFEEQWEVHAYIITSELVNEMLNAMY